MQEELKRNQAKNIFEVILKKEGMKFLGWRKVPAKKDVLGRRAFACMPCIMQGHAILSGIVKIVSKMGISTIQSYQGAKIFEAVGLGISKKLYS